MSKLSKSAKSIKKSSKIEKVKPFTELGKLQKEFEKRERALAADRVDSKKKRESRSAKERKEATDIMKKSLVNYPKNPRVWEAADAESKGKGKVQPNARKRAATRKAGKAGQRELRKAERLALREEKKLAKVNARTERLATKEARKQERLEKRALVNMPAIVLTAANITDILEDVQTTFDLNDRATSRMKATLERMGKFPPRRLRNQLKKLQIRVALMKGVNDLVSEALKSTVTEEIHIELTPAERKKLGLNKNGNGPAKSGKFTWKKGDIEVAVEDEQEAREATPTEMATLKSKLAKSPEQRADEAISEAKKRSAGRADKAAAGAALVMAGAFKPAPVKSEPKPAPKATAGKPIAKKVAAPKKAAAKK